MRIVPDTHSLVSAAAAAAEASAWSTRTGLIAQHAHQFFGRRGRVVKEPVCAGVGRTPEPSEPRP